MEEELRSKGPFSVNDIERIKELIVKRYADVFSEDIKCMKWEFFLINMKEGIKPCCMNALWPIPYILRLAVEQEFS